ncbi:MAG: WG repeat-containing protein [Paludibacteraceae bacterium]|nr:WG repeat-containing protein [Paludibacteraceae bacterium]
MKFKWLAFVLLEALISLLGCQSAETDKTLIRVISKEGVGYIDEMGNWVVKPQFVEADFFSEGLARVKSMNGKWGFIDKSGKMVVQPQFEGAVNFSEGLAAVAIGGKLCFIDKTGKVVIKTQDVLWENEFSEGLCAVDRDGKWAFIDRTGKTVIPPKFWDRSYTVASEGLIGAAMVVSDQTVRLGYFDKAGNLVFEPNFNSRKRFDGLVPFSEGLAPFFNNDKLVFLNKKGEETIKTQFDGGYSFSEGLAPVNLNDKWGFIDKSGKTVIQLQFDYAGGFSNGLAKVQKDGKFGVINKSGEMLVQPKFDKVLIYQGVIVVETDKKCGIVDKTGKYLVSPQSDWYMDEMDWHRWVK